MDFPWNSVIDGVTNLIGNAQQNQYNKQLAEYQNAFNLEMWNKQNEYNSPTATIQRLVDAGINPRAYNQLGQFANSADAPQAAQYNQSAPLSAFSDVVKTMFEFKQMDTMIRKTESEIATEEQKRDKMKAEIASMLTRDDKKAFQTEEQKIKKQYARMQTLETLERLFEGGHNVTGLVGEFDIPFFEGNLKYKGIRNEGLKSSTELRNLESWFKKYDKDTLLRYGFDPRANNFMQGAGRLLLNAIYHFFPNIHY